MKFILNNSKIIIKIKKKYFNKFIKQKKKI